MDDNDGIPFSVWAFFTFIIFGLVGCWSWYLAGVQSEVYKRQGVEMSQFECFVGAKPVERTINVK